MALTPLDIRKTEFTRRLRGFDPEEVVAYLELLAREYEGMLHEVQSREDRIRDLESRIQHYERIELALEEALRTTRDSQRQAVEAAHQKADQIRAEASREAEQLTKDAEQQRNRMRQEAQAIAVRRKEIVARLRAFLMSEMEVLAHFEGEDPVGFIKLMPQAERASLSEHPSEHSLAEGRTESGAPPAETPAVVPRVVLPAEPVPGGSEPVTPPYGVEPVPHADHPTPPPDAFDAGAPPQAPADPERDLTAELEAYFQNLSSDEAAAPASETASDTSAWSDPEAQALDLVPPAYGTSGQDWAPEGQDWAPEGQDWAMESPAHAPEPGETPVPEAPFDETLYSEASFEAEPSGDEVPAGESAEVADVTADVAADVATQDYEVREVRRERYRIESFVGPAPSAAPPDADATEESDRIRRLLDSLD